MLAPTLIVGLGGVGGNIVKRVCLQTSEEKKKRVKFVAIDTDVNDLERLHREAPQVKTIQTSAPYTVGEYLYNNTTARDTWFPTHHILDGKTPTEGAGQVRAISRLAFDTALREGRMRPLEKAIEELYTLNGESVQQALRVIVVASLAGGTGSGIILPASVYIKNFLEKRLKRSACVMRGFLLLPDVFFSGKGPEEINNLSCNGYASLRELDAFMRRSDTEGDDGMFREMTLLMPDTTTGEYVDYKNAPFNFCFLFGAQNTADQDLRSFEEYREQAANIVYAQAVSALSGRSNSNEDNTILTLCSGNGHNRFCGAGSSRMKYPKEDVVRYLADRWALKAMSEDWLAVDEEYKKYCKRQEELQERDPSVEIQPLPEFYMQTVEGKAQASSFFAQIRNNCTEQQTGSSDGRMGRWIHYVEKLDEAIQKAIERQKEFQEIESNIKTDFQRLEDANLDQVKKCRDDLYDHIIELYRQSRGCAMLAAADVINNVLLQDGDLTESPDARNLEYWLRDGKKQFLHPAAVRYFLCGLSRELFQRVQDEESTVETTRRAGNTLDLFLDDPDTVEEEGITQYEVTRKFLRVREIVDSDQVEQLIEECTNFQGNIRKDFEETTKLLVLQEAQKMVDKLLDGVHMFFDTLQLCLDTTRRESQSLYGRYNNGEGHAVYYVCADAACLDALAEKMAYTGGNINGAMGAAVFAATKKVSLGKKKPSSKDFQKMYEDTIMPFWEQSVLRKHGAELETNVIDALRAEAEIYLGEDAGEEDRQQYCMDKFTVTAKLAEPFIEKPMGEQYHPIAVSCYSRELYKKYGEFLDRALSDEGGISEEGIGDDEIIFYHAIYGIRATDLAQFSPAVDSGTFKRRAGSYFAAYKNRVQYLGPVLSKNSVITPHLDRNWHLAKYMPDLNDQVHEEEIKRVYRAMVWGLVSGNIHFNLADRLYVPESNDNRDFIVPSKEGDAAKDNPCDKLSELQDALSVNPPQVTRILRSLETQMSNELRDRKRFGETLLARRLKWHDPEKIQQTGDGRNVFRISEFDPDTDASIFDILYWVKYSTPADDYSVAKMNLLRDAILELLEYYVGRFVEESAAQNAFAMVMVDQLRQFVDNMLQDRPGLPANRILDDTVGMVTSSLTCRFREEYLLESPELEDTVLFVESQIKKIRDKFEKNPFLG